MRRPAASELLAWVLVGTAFGVAVGFVAGEFFGPVLRRSVRRLGTPDEVDRVEGAPPLTPRELVRVVRAALARDPALKDLPLEPLPVGRGVVELHGWVPTRALRARAVRVVRAIPGLESLVNCLLVEGEDDPLTPAGSRAGQSA